MGSAVSVPERVDKATAAQLAGESWSAELEAQFDAAAAGAATIGREQLLGLQRDVTQVISSPVSGAVTPAPSSGSDTQAAHGSGSSVVPLDMERGLVEYGSLEKFQRFAAAFARSEMVGKLADIRTAAAAEDWKAVHIHSHALKGSSGTACAAAIHQTCKQLQHLCDKQGKLVGTATAADDVQKLVTELVSQCDRLNDACGIAVQPAQAQPQQAVTINAHSAATESRQAAESSSTAVLPVLDWLRDIAKVGDDAEQYAATMASEGFDTPGAWVDLPAELEYLMQQLGMKRGHAARVLRLIKI